MKNVPSAGVALMGVNSLILATVPPASAWQASVMFCLTGVFCFYAAYAIYERKEKP